MFKEIEKVSKKRKTIAPTQVSVEVIQVPEPAKAKRVSRYEQAIKLQKRKSLKPPTETAKPKKSESPVKRTDSPLMKMREKRDLANKNKIESVKQSIVSTTVAKRYGSKGSRPGSRLSDTQESEQGQKRHNFQTKNSIEPYTAMTKPAKPGKKERISKISKTRIGSGLLSNQDQME